MQAFKEIITSMKKYTRIHEARVKEAYFMAKKYHDGQQRSSGEPYITHPIAVAKYLVKLGADEDTVIAALLHDAVEDTPLSLNKVRSAFGNEVALLVDGVTKISKAKFQLGETERQFQTLRKMFEIMGRDIRCVIIKICDRLHNVSTLASLPQEKQIQIARKTLQIYVPICKKLNLEGLRKKLLRECYQILYPDIFAAFLKRQQKNTETAEKVKTTIEKILRKSPTPLFEARITVFPKVYFILPGEEATEMERLEVSDTNLIEIAVPEVQQCYEVLFLLHEAHYAKPYSFKDYITNPKENGYRALHTKVVDKKGNEFFLQILTREMSKLSERGITAYWHGKKEGLSPKNIKKLPFRIKWLEDLVRFSKEKEGKAEELEQYLEKDFLVKRIFVLDASGSVFDIAEDATVLDFLYAHSPDQAGFVTKVIVNKHEKPLDCKLESGDKIEFSYGEKLQTNIHWLDIVKTYSAKKRIQTELAKSSTEEKISIGEALLQQEFDAHHRGIISAYPQKKWQEVGKKFGTSSLEELLREVGAGRVNAREIFHQFFSVKVSKKDDLKKFHYDISFQKQCKSDPLSLVTKIAEKNQINVRRITVQEKSEGKELLLEGKSKNPDMFFQDLKREKDISDIRMTLPFQKKLLLSFLSIGVVLLLLSFVAFIDVFAKYDQQMKGFYRGLFTYLPSVVLVIINLTILRTMRNYLKWIRDNRSYILSSVGLNMGSMLLMIGIFSSFQIDFNFFIILGIFSVSILVDSGQYVRTSLDVLGELSKETKPLSETAWQKLKKQKTLGYLLRLAAVIVWGLEPLYIKYTLVNTVAPETRVFLRAAGGLIPSVFFIVFFSMLTRQAKPQLQLPYSKLFVFIILIEILFAYLMNSTLIYTSGTNYYLLGNFAPVFALVIALIFWRDQTPYLKKNRHVLMIFGAFILGGLGSTLLFYNDIKYGNSGDVFGDFLAILTMFADVAFITSVIRYVRRFHVSPSLSLNFYIFFFALVATVPILFLGETSIFDLSAMQILLCIGAGVIAGCGRILTFEAFRRIDGFLAFLMFNISILVTFVGEAFFIHSISSTFLLVIAAIMILSASIFAEYINSKCQKQGL